MRAYDLILKKREGGALTDDELSALLDGYLAGEVPDYQMSAFLMATYFKGMIPDEMGAWTRLMLHSGEVLDLSELEGLKVDKHSTGGVGDKISLPLAPLAAECGVIVPMISGRGLGHTGGTLDKLESIPGFRVGLSLREFRSMLADIGVSMIGQTGEVAPADKRLYALRDVTATVESIPLIASSIMSKKLAEGIDGLVLDVKTGSGAFMKTPERARALASALLSIAESMGKRGRAYLTDMNQPLGAQVGNSLEVIESIETLKGQGPADVAELTLEFAAAMIVLADRSASHAEARSQAAEAIYSGRALERFRRMIELQGGDPRVVDDYERLPLAPEKLQVPAPRGGFVHAIDTQAIGIASMMLGAGRARAEDDIDPGVGLTIRKRIGSEVVEDEPLVAVWYRPDFDPAPVISLIQEAYTISDEAATAPPLIASVLETGG
jgi:pyrimidine-nucleoside phosphorylase